VRRQQEHRTHSGVIRPSDEKIQIEYTPSLDETFRSMVELLPQGIALHADGKVIYANPRLIKMLGFSDSFEVIGRPWRDFVDARDVNAAANNVANALWYGSQEAFEPVERRLVGKDGAPIDVELVAVPLDVRGRPALMVLAHDLSPRKRLEAQLKEADHMAAVGRLAAGVAHEINNPLAYVLGNLTFAREQIQELTSANVESIRPPLAEAIAEAHQGSERMRQVVSDLKTFTRRDERQMELVDVRKVMDSTIKMAQAEIRHRARLSRAYGTPPQVKANETRIAQVFLNLLMNAAQAIPEGRVQQHEITVTIGGDRASRGACIEVRDTGVGISPAILPRVMEPFFTTKPVGVGTGLGLSVCRNIVEGYGGKLQIESEVGRGTTVRVILPEAPTDYVPRTASITMQAVRPTRYRVLVVDDDPMILRSFARMLRNHDLTMAQSGREAIEIISDRKDFDVILCDLMMPELTGMDVFEKVKQLGAGVERRMVFLSGGVFTERARTFLEQVPNLRFEKPIEPHRLEAALASAVENAEKGE
jgi:PAS domain S-box-containing protein